MTRFSHLHRTLVGATDPRIQQVTPTLILVVLTSTIHLVSSIDLATGDIPVRFPIAVLSVLPAIWLIRLAHLLVSRLSLAQVPTVIAAYVLGGSIRGWILETLLDLFNLIDPEAIRFRIFSGAIITTFAAMAISYAWSTATEARSKNHALRVEMMSLQRTLDQLAQEKRAEQVDATLSLSQRVIDELTELAVVDSTEQRNRIHYLVNDVVRPLSREHAPEWATGVTRAGNIQQVSWPTFWKLLDVVPHLPAPLLSAIAVAVSASTPIVGLYGWRTSAELVGLLAITLFATTYLSYPIFYRVIPRLPHSLQSVGVTFGFVLVAVPPAFATVLALSNTPNPYAYFVPGLVTIPIFAWVVIIGNAARAYTMQVHKDLEHIRDQLKWSIARLNVVAWYHRGLITRLLHGPIQNSLQVALLEMQASDDGEKNFRFIENALHRIDEAIRDSQSAAGSAEHDLLAMQSAMNSWRSVAQIRLAIDAQSQSALRNDAAGCAVFTDIVLEICSNAIRHGRANKLAIESALTSAGIVIHIRENGHWHSEKSELGLGTELMVACSLRLERTSTHQENHMMLELPLGNQPPASEQVTVRSST